MEKIVIVSCLDKNNENLLEYYSILNLLLTDVAIKDLSSCSNLDKINDLKLDKKYKITIEETV